MNLSSPSYQKVEKSIVDHERELTITEDFPYGGFARTSKLVARQLVPILEKKALTRTEGAAREEFLANGYLKIDALANLPSGGVSLYFEGEDGPQDKKTSILVDAKLLDLWKGGYDLTLENLDEISNAKRFSPQNRADLEEDLYRGTRFVGLMHDALAGESSPEGKRARIKDLTGAFVTPSEARSVSVTYQQRVFIDATETFLNDDWNMLGAATRETITDVQQAREKFRALETSIKKLRRGESFDEADLKAAKLYFKSLAANASQKKFDTTEEASAYVNGIRFSQAYLASLTSKKELEIKDDLPGKDMIRIFVGGKTINLDEPIDEDSGFVVDDTIAKGDFEVSEKLRQTKSSKRAKPSRSDKEELLETISRNKHTRPDNTRISSVV